MKTIVGIDVLNKKDFGDKLLKLNKFLPKGAWIHIDLADKKFTKSGSFVDFDLIKKLSKKYKFEVHLMLDYKKIIDNKIFNSSVSTVFIHNEVVKDWEFIRPLAKMYKKKIGIVFGYNTNKKEINIPKWIKYVQVLGVVPGPAGQELNKKTFSLVSFLRKKYPYVIISVDGGINERTAKLVKKFGGDKIISTSYIWNDNFPQKAYNRLKAV